MGNPIVFQFYMTQPKQHVYVVGIERRQVERFVGDVILVLQLEARV